VGSPVVLADTVGFIRELPHDLIAAFRATLEEAREADLLLHVIDAADPERGARIEQVERVLAEIGADAVPRLQVFNKIDQRTDELPHVERDEAGAAQRVYVSALRGNGLDLLRAAIAQRLRPESVQEFELVLPPQAARLRARLFAHRAVRAERIAADGSCALSVSIDYQRLRGLYAEAGMAAPALEALLPAQQRTSPARRRRQ